MSVIDYPIVHMVEVTRLGNKKHHIKLELSSEQCQQVAKAYDLIEVKQLEAQLELRTWRKNGVAISGVIDAEVIQQCIISLEPVREVVHDSFERTFLPEEERGTKRKNEDSLELLVDMEEKDPPETFSGSSLDVGAVICEHFALALNNFPRAAGVEMDEKFAPQPIDEEAEVREKQQASPFAALKKLRESEH
ncbi:YceD family protein [Polycladidibacter stylochi]|uniref:YceD family protein n=1 Tax=Polycladidibacter stylochi TaxID=1807766 RepID=UPI00083404EF|nr:DUF177 domain-containing protein [Pseudovibrio stylochi]